MAVEKSNRRCRKVVYYLTIPTFPDKILENTRFLVFIIKYVDKVSISIDGINDEGTARYRSGGIFQRVLDAVDTLKKMA